jgi:hypothetical protein
MKLPPIKLKDIIMMFILVASICGIGAFFGKPIWHSDITYGDYLQISIGFIFGIASLLISLVALNYSYFKGANINLLQQNEKVEFRSSGSYFRGVPTEFYILVPCYIENIGYSDATIMNIDIKFGYNYQMTYHKYKTSDIVQEQVSGVFATLEIPQIISAGKLVKCYVRAHFWGDEQIKQQNKDEEEFVNLVKNELKQFPEKLTFKITLNYRDGRGREEVYKHLIEGECENVVERVCIK